MHSTKPRLIVTPPDQPEGRCRDRQIPTPREFEVLALIVEGLTNDAIADKLRLSIKTVEKHRQSIHRRLHVTNLMALIHAGVEHGWVVVRP